MLDLDLIAVDAGSMDAGPYYLGSGEQYVGGSALKRDLELVIAGAIEKDCPLIIGSAGFSGGDVSLKSTVDLVKELLEESVIQPVRLAVIPSGVPGNIKQEVFDKLEPLGEMPPLTRETWEKSVVVAQMGCEPIMAALDEGAQIIVCGRAYDPAIFSADPIRRGYPKGVCLHAAKILECGAIACEPGSGSDCLIGEITREGKAMFFPTNRIRSATIRSVAAHTLYEKSAPDIFRFPGGLLNIQNTLYSQECEDRVSLSGSQYQAEPYSVKLEGSRSLGKRVISIVSLKSWDGIPSEIPVYGRNGVEARYVKEPIEEMGIVVVAQSVDARKAKDALAFVRSTMLHFGYEGRISTAGNLAFPLSPSDLELGKNDGLSAALFVAGSRDPIFQGMFIKIWDSILLALNEQHPDLGREVSFEYVIGDRENPIALLETVGRTYAEAKEEHQRKERSLNGQVDALRSSFSNIEAGVAYAWSVHHLLRDQELIGKFFPIEISNYSDGEWSGFTHHSARYEWFESSENCDRVDETLNGIEEDSIPGNYRKKDVPLQQVAQVIRSKNAGINEITYDILFNSEAEYEQALQSGAFSPSEVAAFMELDRNQIRGCFRYDPALAIKLTLRRDQLCGSPGERDTFGAQQHTRLLALKL